MKSLELFRKTHRKGQSAIEYLTTYGWAILAIVIAGAVILVLLNQNESATCPKTAPATLFAGENVQLQNWQFIGSSQVEIQVRNAGVESVTLSGVWVDSNQDETFSEGNNSTSATINAGATVTRLVSNVSGLSAGCNEIDFAIDYAVSGLSSSNHTGSLRGPI